nr:hypothetical protein [Acinetobacter sp. TUM15380]
MWLASFIERITTGGQPKLPPLSSIVPDPRQYRGQQIPLNS